MLVDWSYIHVYTQPFWFVLDFVKLLNGSRLKGAPVALVENSM